MRRGEAAPLQWRDMLTDKQATVSNWVDLKSRTVHLHDTKNGTEHDLPIVDAAYEILARRHEDRDKSKGAWVFPARSSKAVSGHYKDSKSILKGVRETAGIDLLRTHDLRRTFGAIAEEVASYAVVKALLNHRRLDDVTERYTKPDTQRMKEAMTRIERVMLASAPGVERAIIGHIQEEQ